MMDSFCVGLQIADPKLYDLCLLGIGKLLVSNGRSLKEICFSFTT